MYKLSSVKNQWCEFECENGHINHIVWLAFLNSPVCKECEHLNKLTKYNIKKIVEILPCENIETMWNYSDSYIQTYDCIIELTDGTEILKNIVTPVIYKFIDENTIDSSNVLKQILSDFGIDTNTKDLSTIYL